MLIKVRVNKDRLLCIVEHVKRVLRDGGALRILGLLGDKHLKVLPFADCKLRIDQEFAVNNLCVGKASTCFRLALLDILQLLVAHLEVGDGDFAAQIVNLVGCILQVLDDYERGVEDHALGDAEVVPVIVSSHVRHGETTAVRYGEGLRGLVRPIDKELAMVGLVLVAPMEWVPVLRLQRDAPVQLAHLEVRLAEEDLLVCQVCHDELRRDFDDSRKNRLLLGYMKSNTKRSAKLDGAQRDFKMDYLQG